MMITRRTRLITLGLIILILLLLLAWLWLALRPKQELVSEVPVSDIQPEGVTVIDERAPSLSEENLKKEQNTRNQASGATTIAKLFVERYGSYSNEAEFQNLVDVLPLMTDSFAGETKALIASSQPPESYYGVSTAVLTVAVEEMDETKGVAKMKMQTQREISEGSTQNTSVKYQEIRLELIKEAGVWKVNSAIWL